MYTYKNKNTGAVISTHGKVTGANWELVKSDKKGAKPAEKAKNGNQKPAAEVKKDEEKQEENGQEEAEE